MTSEFFDQHEWDDIFQIGWQLKKLVSVLKKNQKEVTLTLKKRPRHANLGPPGNRRRNKLKQSTFPKSVKRRSSDKSSRPALKDYLQPPSEPYMEIK